jgi:hypothetical protein
MNTNNNVQPATKFFQVHESDGVCKTPQTMILFHLALWVAPALCQFILGNSLIRDRISYLRIKRGALSVHSKREEDWLCFQIWFFLLRLICENVGAAIILTKATTSISFTHAFLIWLVRPQPSTFLTIISFADIHMFSMNAMENQFLEALLSFASIGTFGVIQASLPSQRLWMNQNLHPITSTEHTGYIRIRDGSKFGIAALVLEFIAIFGAYIHRKSDSKGNGYSFFVAASLPCNFIRMTASFVVWIAIPMLNNTAFCPSTRTTGALFGLSAGIAVLDHLLRARLSADDEDRESW